MYAAFAKRDIRTILNAMADDVEWILDAPPVVPYPGRRRGPAQAADFFALLGSTERDQKLTIDEYIDGGDNIVTLGRYTATVKNTGKKIDAQILHVFTIKNGKITRFIDGIDTAQLADAHSGRAVSA